MHTVGHCAVWLVLLDPERSIHHAKAPAPQEGPGRCELDHREPPWSRTFQLAPGGRLGPQPVPGERGTERALRVQTHRQSHPRLGPNTQFLISREASLCCDTCYFTPLQCVSRLNDQSPSPLPTAVPGHVSRWALHWEDGEGSHGEVQEAAGGGHQLHQAEERRKEAALLQHVPRQNPKQCRCLRGRWPNVTFCKFCWYYCEKKFYNAYALTEKSICKTQTLLLNCLFSLSLIWLKNVLNVIAESSQ